MAEATLLGERIQPAWQALTPEQRSCWHFWAQLNPILTATGELQTLYGQQAHYRVNANLALIDTPTLRADPPTSTAPPTSYRIISISWPLAAELAFSVVTRGSFAILQLTDPAPVGKIGTITQGYYRKKKGAGRPPRIRHVTVIVPGQTGLVALNDPQGYFATTGGNNRYSRIEGRRARARPDQPLATIKVVSAENGMTVRQILTNPNGGGRKKINRPRATAVKPRAGDHYP